MLTMQDSTIVYAAGNLLSARFIDDNLITGFGSGGVKITDLITGKKIANTRAFEEFAPAKYRYIGWIEKAEKISLSFSGKIQNKRRKMILGILDLLEIYLSLR